jgi:aspartate/methionine/tyrosine aminotransferase
MPRTSAKADAFSESVIREMSRLAALHSTPERPVVNLAQGFPDFPAPAEVKEAAVEAIRREENQYAITWGAKPFRDAIAESCRRHHGWSVDPETELTVTCGATEGMIASLLAVIDPGDEVIVFEPFYENYGPDAVLSGAVPAYVPLDPGDGFALDAERLEAAITPRTRGIILNSPNNPTGKVFDLAELELIRDLCVRHDLVAFTDEIYEHIVYGDARHIPLATLEGMAERTCTVNALSKTFSVTGWRVGWVVAPPALTAGIRKVHDFLTVGAAAPLQAAGAVAMRLPDDYFEGLAAFYEVRRERLLGVLDDIGLRPIVPDGAYYAMADCSPYAEDDVAFAKRLITDVGVAVVPGSSFFREPEGGGPSAGARWVRFAFCKELATLDAAAERLKEVASW